MGPAAKPPGSAVGRTISPGRAVQHPFAFASTRDHELGKCRVALHEPRQVGNQSRVWVLKFFISLVADQKLPARRPFTSGGRLQLHVPWVMNDVTRFA